MKFHTGQRVVHMRSTCTYEIIGTPDRYRLEATGEPAYAYTSGKDQDIWVRSQTEMEDGRFEAIATNN